MTLKRVDSGREEALALSISIRDGKWLTKVMETLTLSPKGIYRVSLLDLSDLSPRRLQSLNLTQNIS